MVRVKPDASRKAPAGAPGEGTIRLMMGNAIKRRRTWVHSLRSRTERHRIREMPEYDHGGICREAARDDRRESGCEPRSRSDLWFRALIVWNFDIMGTPLGNNWDLPVQWASVSRSSKRWKSNSA